MFWNLFGMDRIEGAEFKQPKPIRPSIAAASEEPFQAMKAIQVPSQWDINVFAAEPDVANIVAFDVDNQGRVFVCESFRQSNGVTDNRNHNQQWLLADLAAKTVQDRIDYHKRLLGESAITYAQQDDRLRLLMDTDRDGKADQSFVFAEGFNRIEEGTGAGVLSRSGTVYYTNIPKLWRLTDDDGDGISDTRRTLSDGFGVKVALRGHDLHGIIKGPDGRLYFTIGDRGYNVTTDDGRIIADVHSGAMFRCEMDGSNLEVVSTGLRNPQEIAFNAYGDFFTVDNNSDSGDKARIVQLLEGGDSGWRMHYQYLPDRGPFNRQRIWEPLHEEQPAYIVPPVANFADGPSGLTYYPGTGFGERLLDTFLLCDFRGGPASSGVRTFKLEPAGAFYHLVDQPGEGESANADSDSDANASSDSKLIWNVLATDIAFGPDGALYISDWVNGWNGQGKGRLYRITDPGHTNDAIVKEVQRLLKSNWNKLKVKRLSELLSHVDRRVRLEAQWELANRSEREALLGIASDPDQTTLPRLHAIWGVSQIARTTSDDLERSKIVTLLRPLLASRDPVIVAATAEVLGNQQDMESSGALRALLASPSDRVQYHATMAIAKLKDPSGLSDVVKFLVATKGSDPALRHAAAFYFSKAVAESELANLTTHPNATVRRTVVVALRRMKSGRIAEFLNDKDPLVVREAACAIHDVPIRVANKSLAEISEQSLQDPQLSSRVINTHFRMGTSKSAEWLAKLAGRASTPLHARIDALDALEHWGDDDPRDRVLNVHRPLSSRKVADATQAINRQVDALMAAPDTVRDRAITVAASLGAKKIVAFLSKQIAKRDSSAQSRAAALLSLAKLDPEAAILIARQTQLNRGNDFVLASLDILRRLDSEASIQKFITASQQRDLDVQRAGWDALAMNLSEESTARIVQAVQDYLDGNLPSGVHLNVLEAAAGRLDPELDANLRQHQTTIAQTDSLGPWLASLDGGDPEHGKELFFERSDLSCVRCHQVDGVGGKVGPVLSDIGNAKDRRYLLESIAIPDATIARGYETTVVASDSGEVYSGVVQSENEDEIELILGDGSIARIDLEEIAARKKGISSMPEDLAKMLSARELRDLVAYLASLKKDVVTSRSVH
jgi:quinoprotein glucose dehydrogenase